MKDDNAMPSLQDIFMSCNCPTCNKFSLDDYAKNKLFYNFKNNMPEMLTQSKLIFEFKGGIYEMEINQLKIKYNKAILEEDYMLAKTLVDEHGIESVKDINYRIYDTGWTLDEVVKENMQQQFPGVKVSTTRTEMRNCALPDDPDSSL